MEVHIYSYRSAGQNWTVLPLENRPIILGETTLLNLIYCSKCKGATYPSYGIVWCHSVLY